MLRVILLSLLAVAHALGACAAGTIQISDTLLNPDGSTWSGSIVYRLAYATLITGGTVPAGQQSVNINAGVVSLCLVPGLYQPVTLRQQSQQFAVTTTWTVPVSGGPYSIAQIQGTVQFVPLSVTTPLTYNPATGALACVGCTGGGGGLLQAVTVTLSESQMVNLMSTGVTLVAQTTGDIIRPQTIIIQIDQDNYSSNAGCGDDEMIFGWGAVPGLVQQGPQVSAISNTGLAKAMYDFSGNGLFGGNLASKFESKNLIVYADNPVSCLSTCGNVTITVLYYLYAVAM